jgi:hypothetical protein
MRTQVDNRDPILIPSLPACRNLHAVRLKWRFGLVAIIAAAVIGGFMPHGVLSAGENAATEMVQIAEAPVSVPASCMDVTCGKGTPAAPAPAPVLALAAVLMAMAVAAAVAGTIRHQRARGGVLPAGATDPLFHPPKFS